MNIKLTTLACLLGLVVSSNIMAETELEKLRSEVDALNQKAKEWEAYKEPKAKLQQDVSVLNEKAQEWEEWKAPKTLVHLAGFASMNYIDKQGAPGTFSMGSFSPIFHYQFADSFMLEAELEFEVNEDGTSDAGVEYMTIDWFMNDYATLVAGRFLSPLGQFRQNTHPSWINKMASAPTGFGHDEAAPNADVGLMVRGGYLMANSTSFNYALYVANGPTLEQDGGEVSKIESPGLNKDGDGKKTVGGRFGMFLPNQKFEFGVSLATGKVSVRSGSSGAGYTYDASRSYDVRGTDFAWRPGNFDVRGEYVQQEYGAEASSVAPGSGKWAAWYVQAAYRFPVSNWEAVMRYAQYDTPLDSADRNQSTLGVNYLFATNLVAKLGYEFNDNPNAGLKDYDRLLVQLAYGF